MNIINTIKARLNPNTNYSIRVVKDGVITTIFASDCHEAKSMAGTMYRNAQSVTEVLVTDRAGKIFLHMSKSEAPKHLIVNVPSEQAVF